MESPLVKQGSILILFLVACTLSVLLGGVVPVLENWLFAALMIMIAATAVAVWKLRVPGNVSVEAAIIAAGFLAIALMRYATGGPSSSFSFIFLLPFVWMATLAGRKYVWFSALGVFFVLLLNVPLDLLLFDRQTELPFRMRGLWTPLVSLLAALLVNEMSRIARMHLRESEARARAVGAELDQAAIVQRALFPKDTQVVQGVSFAGSCVPSRSVGGDFFDWYPIEGGMAITLGDVMGKGVGAGMVAATARAVVRGSALFPDPVLAVHQLGRFIESELRDEPTFLTLFHDRLEVETGGLHYIDAGHGLTLLVRPDGSHDTLRSSNRPVGIIPGDTWVRHQVIVEPGDTVVSFSDGVLDLLGGHMSAVDEIARMTIAAPPPPPSRRRSPPWRGTSRTTMM